LGHDVVGDLVCDTVLA